MSRSRMGAVEVSYRERVSSSRRIEKRRQGDGHSLESRDDGDKTKARAKRIAIVDDEESICSLFSLLIRNLGYHVEIVARSGEEIVEAVARGRVEPDLILMDYRMSIMNGLEAARRILNENPAIKIIVTTADDSVKQEAVSSGLYFLQKPFSISVLEQTISSALSN
jgi:CheY-like chemotaxis protein